MPASALHDFQQAAQQAFDQTGFDLKHVETWRYTNLARLLPTLSPNPSPANGRGELALCRDDGAVSIQPLADILKTNPAKVLSFLEQHPIDYKKHPLAALNHTQLQHGLWIEIADNAVIDQPIELNYTESGCYCHFVFVGKHAKVTILEFAGDPSVKPEDDIHGKGRTQRPAPTLVNSLTNIMCQPGAHVDYCAKQLRGESMSHIANCQVWQSQDSRLNAMHALYGGKVGRFDTHVHLQGEGAECHLKGLFQLQGQSHTDCHICVEHEASYTKSTVVYKGLAADQSTGIWTAKALVHKGVKQVDAQQNNKNLLLSKRAFIHTKPELEIYADDLKCSHGATVGQLDEQALFYLQSRGIDLATAKQMLIDAFCEDILSGLGDVVVKKWLIP